MKTGNERWIVICRTDRNYGDPEDVKPPYVLATRQSWDVREDAEHYAQTCATSREALVIECPCGTDFREGRYRTESPDTYHARLTVEK